MSNHKSKLTLVIASSVFMAIIAFCLIALAQDPGAVPAEGAEEIATTASPFFMDKLIKGFQDGGAFMYIIAMISMFAFAIFLERFYSLVVKFDVNGIALMSKIQNYVVDNQVDRGIKLCNEAPNAVLPVVLKAGLKRATRPQAEIQAAVDVATLEVLSRLQKRTPYLSMLANVATLAGLLGTILGLMESFDSVAHADPSEKQFLLARGIAIAMNTTAFGLIVAIPCLCAFGFLQSKTSKIIDEIDTFSAKMVDLLTIAGKK
jgi:biopolymer transport protein ExbB/TolQ